MNHIGTWESDTVKEPGFQSRRLTAALLSTMRYSHPVVSTSDADSEVITCKSSQCFLSLSEVQMRHRFASDVAMWGEPRDSWTWSEMSPVISKTATAGPVARTREVPGRVHFLARCGDAQIVATAGVHWVQPQQGELVVSKSKESFWIISTLPHIFKR